MYSFFLQEIAEKYDVSAMPTFVALKDGNKVLIFSLLHGINILNLT